MINDLKVVILAAGRGNRINSKEAQIPKAMREAAGKPLLYYVLNAVDFVQNKKDIIIIVGYFKESITESFPEYTFVEQNFEQGYGTGAAVKCAEEAIGEFSGDILILFGDAPLITTETLNNMKNEHIKNKNDCTILSCELNEILNLGRIIRNETGGFCEIIENRDATEEQKKNIKEYNASVMLANSKKLFEQLKNLKNNNKSGEYYLTDIPKLFLENNYKVDVYKSLNQIEIYGADSIEDLIRVEKILSSISAK